MTLPLCHLCRTRRAETFEIFNVFTGGYPRLGEAVKTRLACCHEDCDTGAYYVMLNDLETEEKLQRWRDHLRIKVWYSTEADHDLICAHETAAEHYAATIRHAQLGRPPRSRPSSRNVGPRMRAFVLERDGFRCRRCGNGPDVNPLHVDHIVPVAKGGLTIEKNLQTLCSLCNGGKSDRAPHPHDLRAS